MDGAKHGGTFTSQTATVDPSVTDTLIRHCPHLLKSVRRLCIAEAFDWPDPDTAAKQTIDSLLNIFLIPNEPAASSTQRPLHPDRSTTPRHHCSLGAPASRPSTSWSKKASASLNVTSPLPPALPPGQASSPVTATYHRDPQNMTLTRSWLKT